MRSYQIQYSRMSEIEKSKYSELKILNSAAGYYIGTSYHSNIGGEPDSEEPGSRDSNYFHDRADAVFALSLLEEKKSAKFHYLHPKQIIDDWILACMDRKGIYAFYRWEL